jgi:hypothetical protein
MSNSKERSTISALISGGIVGFIVFGYLGMRFFKEADGPFVPLFCAVSGAVIGAFYQANYGDLLWQRLWNKIK